jgi:MFS family permease
MWGYTTIIIFFIIEEAISGIIWAGFNLSVSNFVYDAVTRERIALCVAYQGILNGIAVFLGATIGGIIASLNFNLLGLTPLLFIFLISFLLRLAVPIFLNSSMQEVRKIELPN